MRGEAIAVKLAFAHAERGARLDHRARVCLLMPFHRGAERNDEQRHAEGERLGDGRCAGPADREVRGGERATHLVAQERADDVALTYLRREIRAARLSARAVLLPGDVEHVGALEDATECGP